MGNQHQEILKNKYLPTAAFYSQIIDSLQDYSIFTIDKDFIINSWSSGSTLIFGYETEEVIGKSFDIIFSDDDLKNSIPKKEIDLALKQGRATDNRWHITKENKLFYAYGLVFPLTGINGELLGFVKILRDLTERKQSEDAIKNYIKELEDLNTHKESVLAILSHDLRSPLSSIISTTKYLKDNFQTMKSETVQEMLELLHTSSVEELDMLDYLVEWARIKHASGVFSPIKIELSTFINKVFQTFNEAASIKTVNLLNQIPENTSVFADEKMLISIIHNIVSNAIKFINDGGEIVISAKSDNGRVIVQIKDTGIGMTQEIIDKLFTPQMKQLLSKRTGNKGAGIGLLLVKGFLGKNGGEIWVESKVGAGSSFYFSLPIDKPSHKIGSSDEIMFDESA